MREHHSNLGYKKRHPYISQQSVSLVTVRTICQMHVTVAILVLLSVELNANLTRHVLSFCLGLIVCADNERMGILIILRKLSRNARAGGGGGIQGLVYRDTE